MPPPPVDEGDDNAGYRQYLDEMHEPEPTLFDRSPKTAFRVAGVVAVFDNYQTRSNRWISMSSFAKNLPPGWIFSPKRAGIKNEPPV